MENYFHSVTLVEEKCKGCTNCIKLCPTEAIRVRNGKAKIINERCIDCGECIRVCPYHAKEAIHDSFDSVYNYEHRIALPAPSLYGQFKYSHKREQILGALKGLGFTGVYEVAKGAEIVTQAAKRILFSGDKRTPIISSACPAVVRLIQVRFPNLLENILRLESPMEVAAAFSRRKYSTAYNVLPAEIGVFFITPCPAKVTSVKAPFDKKYSNVTGVLSMQEIFLKLTGVIDEVDKGLVTPQAGFEGIRWASSGGESDALGTENYLVVDGIRNVAKILEEIEKGKLNDIYFVEALACDGGCLGGALTIENPYVANTRMARHLKDARKIRLGQSQLNQNEDLYWTIDIEHRPILKLDDDLGKAMMMLKELEQIKDRLPGLDCGACGAPNCRALAEDIVRKYAVESDCIFKLREKVNDFAMQVIGLDAVLQSDKEEQK